MQVGTVCQPFLFGGVEHQMKLGTTGMVLRVGHDFDRGREYVNLHRDDHPVLLRWRRCAQTDQMACDQKSGKSCHDNGSFHGGTPLNDKRKERVRDPSCTVQGDGYCKPFLCAFNPIPQ